MAENYLGDNCYLDLWFRKGGGHILGCLAFCGADALKWPEMKCRHIVAEANNHTLMAHILWKRYPLSHQRQMRQIKSKIMRTLQSSVLDTIHRWKLIQANSQGFCRLTQWQGLYLSSSSPKTRSGSGRLDAAKRQRHELAQLMSFEKSTGSPQLMAGSDDCVGVFLSQLSENKSKFSLKAWDVIPKHQMHCIHENV